MGDARTAITEDGREVVLHEDGAWAYKTRDGGTVQERTFRATAWGMTPDQVKAAETAQLVRENDEGIIYRGQASRFPSLIAYLFAQGRLVRAKYNLTVEHASPNEYLNDFEHVHDILERKYGEPTESHRHWIDDRYRDEEESWGKAVALGHLVLWEVYHTESTEISLMLRGEDQRILLEVEYTSRKLGQLEEEEAVDDELEAF